MKLTSLQAYAVMQLLVSPTGNPRDQKVWEHWMRCIESNPPVGMLRLQERE